MRYGRDCREKPLESQPLSPFGKPGALGHPPTDADVCQSYTAADVDFHQPQRTERAPAQVLFAEVVGVLALETGETAVDDKTYSVRIKKPHEVTIGPDALGFTCDVTVYVWARCGKDLVSFEEAIKHASDLVNDSCHFEDISIWED